MLENATYPLKLTRICRICYLRSPGALLPLRQYGREVLSRQRLLGLLRLEIAF